MNYMVEEHITAGEFGRFRVDQQAWQGRLEAQIRDGFNGLNTRLDTLNGRTRENAEHIVRVEAEVEAIQERGCGQYPHHQAVLMKIADQAETLSPSFQWTRKHTGVTVGAGAVVLAIVELIQHFLGIK